MDEQRKRSGGISRLVLGLVGVWVGAGALLKLFAGSPGDLPPAVRSFFLGPDLTFRLAITVELAVATASFVAPRLAWPFATALLAVFVAVLVPLLLSGESTCGCFGSKVAIHPGVMLAIDGGLLVALLATKPWSSLRGGRRRALAAVASLAAGLAAPWIFLQPIQEDEVPVREEAEAWRLPEKPWPRYVLLEPDKWVGRALRETVLARWLDVEARPPDADWILYRINCSHCAAHLRDLAAKFDGTATYVLVRLPEEGDEAAAVVDLKPLAIDEVTLPAEIRWDVQTPWQLTVAGGVVREVEQHRDSPPAAPPPAPAPPKPK